MRNTPHNKAGWKRMIVRLSHVPVPALLLTALPGGAHAQSVHILAPPRLSFRSLPALRSDPFQADRVRLSLIFFPLVGLGEGTSTPAPLAEAERAIRETTGKALAALKAGDAEGCAAGLAPDYEQTDSSGATRNRADVSRSVQADLAGHDCTGADFEIRDLRLLTPTEAIVTVTQSIDLVTKNTPPTVYAAGDGSAYAQNNAVTTHTVTVSRQTWAKRGADWVLVQSQQIDQVTTAIA